MLWRGLATKNSQIAAVAAGEDGRAGPPLPPSGRGSRPLARPPRRERAKVAGGNRGETTPRVRRKAASTPDRSAGATSQRVAHHAPGRPPSARRTARPSALRPLGQLPESSARGAGQFQSGCVVSLRRVVPRRGPAACPCPAALRAAAAPSTPGPRAARGARTVSGHAHRSALRAIPRPRFFPNFQLRADFRRKLRARSPLGLMDNASDF